MAGVLNMPPCSTTWIFKMSRTFQIYLVSSEDPLPYGVFHLVQDDLLPLLVELVNKSLAEGSMEGINSSVIDPLLKNIKLDLEGRKNYRPVTNLVLLSKLTEKGSQGEVR